VDNDHQGSEDVHSNRDEAVLTLGTVIFNGERERIIKHSVALGKRHTVLLDVYRILLRVELGGHVSSICTLCIYVNVDAASHRGLGGFSASLASTGASVVTTSKDWSGLGFWIA
jgi:hypothetical protein